ncbi:MAG: response regulator [Myxococcota bacterium]|nr:response regulator [Myxococcota bacterium]
MHRTLLLADDSIVSQKLVGLAFANEDVTVEVVHSGEDAHRRVQEIRPDIVLVDLGLPGANAYELCEVIKREPETAEVAVVLLADRPGEIDPTMARRARCDAHLVKPLDSEGLVRTIHRVLSSSDEASPAAETRAPAETDFGAEHFEDELFSSEDALDIDAIPEKRLDWLQSAAPGSSGEEPDRPSAVSPRPDADRLHEELREAACAALSQLGNELIEPVVERVEKIAWEVIPQMAEILLQEALSQARFTPPPCDVPENERSP